MDTSPTDTRPAPDVQEHAAVRPAPTDCDHSELIERYGIAVIPLNTYEWGGYRYSNAADAIAAARRAEASGTSR